MDTLYIIVASAVGDHYRGSVVTADQLGGPENAQRHADRGVVSLAPEGATAGPRTPWAGHASYDRTEVNR
jgi:hypothetical protein